MREGADGNRLSPAQRTAWLRLIRTDNVGPNTFRQLLNRYGSAEAALEQLRDLARRSGVAHPPQAVSRSSAEDEIAATEKLGGRIVASGEPDYPELLRFIPAAPPIVTMAGGERLDWSRAVALVGARNASSAGQKFARILAGDLGGRGFTVVSGLARGIDAAAHQASLKTGTVAVLAGGLDHIYPEENVPLAREIANRHQAAVATFLQDLARTAGTIGADHRRADGQGLGQDIAETLPARGKREHVRPRHIGIRIGNETRQAHVVRHAELARELLQFVPLAPFAQDDEPRREYTAQAGKGAQQRREILARAQFAGAENDRPILGRQPGMVHRLGRLHRQVIRDQRAGDRPHTLGGQMRHAGQIQRRAPRRRDHRIRQRIEQSHPQRLQPALQHGARGEIDRHSGADAHRDARIHSGKQAGEEDRAIDPILVAQQERGARAAQIADQRPQRRRHVRDAEIDALDPGRQLPQIRAVPAYLQQIHRVAGGGKTPHQMPRQTVDPAVTGGGEKKGELHRAGIVPQGDRI